MARFLKAERGQSLIEYTLLLSFVALSAMALFLGSGNSISGLWTASGHQLSAANSSLSGSGAPPPRDGDGH
jgi:Flp pilus assembly pilin Flp